MKPILLYGAALLVFGSPRSFAQTAVPIAHPVIHHGANSVVTPTRAMPGTRIRCFPNCSDPTKKAGPYLATIKLPRGGER